MPKPTAGRLTTWLACKKSGRLYRYYLPQQRIVRLLIEKVIVSPNDIEVRLRANGIEELALELWPAVPEEEAA